MLTRPGCLGLFHIFLFGIKTRQEASTIEVPEATSPTKDAVTVQTLTPQLGLPTLWPSKYRHESSPCDPRRIGDDCWMSSRSA